MRRFSTAPSSSSTHVETSKSPATKGFVERHSMLVAGSIPLLMVFGVAASAFGAFDKPRPQSVPAWVDDFKVSPEDEVCRITDLKTGREYISRNGENVKMTRGFSVASSPSSCNVTLHQPYKDDTCQLRGWPIEPIC